MWVIFGFLVQRQNMFMVVKVHLALFSTKNASSYSLSMYFADSSLFTCCWHVDRTNSSNYIPDLVIDNKKIYMFGNLILKVHSQSCRLRGPAAFATHEFTSATNIQICGFRMYSNWIVPQIKNWLESSVQIVR